MEYKVFFQAIDPWSCEILTQEFSVELISQNGVLLKYLTIEVGFLVRWLLLFAEHIKWSLEYFPLC